MTERQAEIIVDIQTLAEPQTWMLLGLTHTDTGDIRRNAYRGTAKMYSLDGKALGWAEHMQVALQTPVWKHPVWHHAAPTVCADAHRYKPLM